MKPAVGIVTLTFLSQVLKAEATRMETGSQVLVVPKAETTRMETGAELIVTPKDLPEVVRRRHMLADALPGFVLELLGSPILSRPEEPFEDDESFLKFLVAKVAVHWRRQEACFMLTKAAVEWPNGEEHSLERQRSCKAALGEACEVLELVQAKKIAAGEARTSAGGGPAALEATVGAAATSGAGVESPSAPTAVQWLQPRFIRLMSRLDLSRKEVRAFEYILVHQAAGDGLRSPAFNDRPLEFVGLRGYTGMSPKEFLDFAMPGRRHMAQGLVSELPDVMGHDYLNNALLSAEAAKALVGMRLTPSEMLKLDQNGALAAVLHEEAEAAAAAGAAVQDPAAPLAEPLADVASAAAGAAAPAKAKAGVRLRGANNETAADAGVAAPALAAGTGAAAATGKRPGRGGPGGRDEAPTKFSRHGASKGKLGLPADVDSLVHAEAGANDDVFDSDGGGRAADDAIGTLLLTERRRDKQWAKAMEASRSRGRRGDDADASPVGIRLADFAAAAPRAEKEDGDGHIRAYRTDLEYLVDAVELVSQKTRLHKLNQRLEDASDVAGFQRPFPSRRHPFHSASPADDLRRARQRQRELEGLVKQLGRTMEERMRLTREAADSLDKGLGWTPRLERVVSSRKMSSFETEVLIVLVGNVLLPSKFQYIMEQSSRKGLTSGGAFVGDLLCALSPDLQAQLSNRRAFYKDGALVRDGIVHVGSNGLRGDLTTCPVEIDRRMVDFIMGLDSEVHQLVDGSHMYVPKTRMDQVVLAPEVKGLITSTVQNFAAFRRNKEQYGLAETIAASGLVMLFYGDSGTGKTMTANAIAHMLDKKMLLMNFPSLGGPKAAAVVRMIFRESKINDAVLFFDECESIFESREKSMSRDVNMLLTEIERHDGLIILATNRPYDLDEAMHRRITLSIEFHKPDHILRRDIWKALLPPALPLAEDVDVSALAMRYELTGGFIKNAILSALSTATARATEKDQPGQVTVTQEDFINGAQLQLRGRIAMGSFERRVVPKRGLEGLICAEDVIRKVQAVVDFEKSKTVLYGQWGFGGTSAFSSGQPQIGSCVLFFGPPGTGKSLAAQALAFEVGRPLKVVNAANVVDKYVGQTGKNIEKVFSEARAMDAVLVFDEAEGLFGRRMATAVSAVDKHTNMDTGLLLHWLESYPGLCILTTNSKEAIDSAFFRRFRFIVEFPRPDRATRTRLWRSCIPAQAPLAEDADLSALATEFESFSGGDIQNAVIRAASRAALRTPEDQRIILMEDLRTAAREEGGKQADESVSHMYA